MFRLLKENSKNYIVLHNGLYDLLLIYIKLFGTENNYLEEEPKEDSLPKAFFSTINELFKKK